MKPNEASQGKLTTINDIISPDSSAQPQVTKITRKIVTTSQPVTETKVISRKIITTTTKGNQPNVVQNTRYNNISSSTPNLGKTTTTTNYKRPIAVSTVSSNRNIVTNSINNRSSNINNNNNQGYRNNQRPVNQSNQVSRVQNAKSYSGNRTQPKRIEVSASHYKPRVNSPSPGSAKIKTINRGKPIENVQITHIIVSSQPLEFHITEDLNLDNLNTQPIKITDEQRNNLQKSGKIEVTCSCDNIEIKPKQYDLTGNLIHYQHAQGIGMTDDKKENLNPQYYNSEIKILEPLVLSKGEPVIEVLNFRSNGKNYTTTKTVTKTTIKPVVINNTNKSTNNYAKNRTYNNTSQVKNSTNVVNRGNVRTSATTSSTSNYRGKPTTGNSGGVVKETNTKVTMGSRSQFQNKNPPIVTTSVERKVYNNNKK